MPARVARRPSDIRKVSALRRRENTPTARLALRRRRVVRAAGRRGSIRGVSRVPQRAAAPQGRARRGPRGLLQAAFWRGPEDEELRSVNARY